MTPVMMSHEMKRKRRDSGLWPNIKTRRKNRFTVPSVACYSVDSALSNAFILTITLLI